MYPTQGNNYHRLYNNYYHYNNISLLYQNVLMNKPTLKGDFSNDSLPDDKNAENSDQTPMYRDHNAPSKKFTKPISAQNSYDSFYEVLDSKEAQLMVLKSFIIDGLYAINLNTDRVRKVQCDQTKKFEENS